MNDSQSSDGSASAREATETACWSCDGTVDVRALFCHTCGKIQPCRPTDHFTRLGLKPQFELDPDELERQYIGFQRRFHPDRFATAPATEKTHSLQHATALNEAYAVLGSSQSRALHLLEVHNPELKNDASTTIDDPELLILVMEMREALASAETAGQIAEVIDAATEAIEECQSGLTKAFAADELDLAQSLAARLSYLDKISDEARLKARSHLN
jgi:molecular chaperone HscB